MASFEREQQGIVGEPISPAESASLSQCAQTKGDSISVRGFILHSGTLKKETKENETVMGKGSINPIALHPNLSDKASQNTTQEGRAFFMHLRFNSLFHRDSEKVTKAGTPKWICTIFVHPCPFLCNPSSTSEFLSLFDSVFCFFGKKEKKREIIYIRETFLRFEFTAGPHSGRIRNWSPGKFVFPSFMRSPTLPNVGSPRHSPRPKQKKFGFPAFVSQPPLQSLGVSSRQNLQKGFQPKGERKKKYISRNGGKKESNSEREWVRERE